MEPSIVSLNSILLKVRVDPLLDPFTPPISTSFTILSFLSIVTCNVLLPSFTVSFTFPLKKSIAVDFSPLSLKIDIDILYSPSSNVDAADTSRSEEHTSELQSRSDIVCCLLLDKKQK